MQGVAEAHQVLQADGGRDRHAVTVGVGADGWLQAVPVALLILAGEAHQAVGLLHAQEGSQQQRQEDLHSGGTGVWLGSQEAEVSPPADAGTRPGGVPAQTAR